MPQLRYWLSVALLLATCLCASARLAVAAEMAIPPPQPVTDLSGTLSAAEQSALSQKLLALKAETGSELAVLIIPTTQPEDIAQYSIRVADAWKLGRKGVDDGVILLIATQDHRVRVEVGRGLEGAITDLASNRVIDEYLQPYFRAGRFYEGIDHAVDRLIGLVQGESLPPPTRSHAVRHGGGAQSVLVILLMIGFVIGPFLRSMLGRPLGALATGGIAGGVVFLLVGGTVIAVLAGVAGAVLSLMAGLGGGLGMGGFGGYGGGFGGGGFGGDSGGGFGGGGGGFGGGGASGSW